VSHQMFLNFPEWPMPHSQASTKWFKKEI
jgi:hypothetical protein